MYVRKYTHTQKNNGKQKKICIDKIILIEKCGHIETKILSLIEIGPTYRNDFDHLIVF